MDWFLYDRDFRHERVNFDNYHSNRYNMATNISKNLKLLFMIATCSSPTFCDKCIQVCVCGWPSDTYVLY